MPTPPGWDGQEVLRRINPVPFEGETWRAHDRKYPATDSGGSIKTEGRYHSRHPVLYLALSKAVALAEFQRHTTAATLARLKTIRITPVHIRLEAVLDCRDLATIGLTLADITHDLDLDVPRALGLAARGLGAEAIIVPSATLLDLASGGCIVVFTDNLRPGSRLEEGTPEDPNLFRS